LGSHSRLHSDITWTPAHVHARTLLGLLLTSALGLYSETCSSSVIHPPLRSTRPPHCNPIFTYTNLTRSSVSIHAMSSRNSTRTFRSGIRSDIRVSIHLTSPSPRLRTPFRPPSSSALPSEPLSSNSARRSARTSVSRSASRVRAHAFGARSDLCHCPRYECRVDPNRL
jgi:hypothetical protein